MTYLFGKYDVTQRVIVDNELAFAFPTNSPIVPGHTLICPKRIVARYEELSGPEVTAVEELRVRIKSALEKAYGAQGFNYAWNENVAAGQSISHLHLHIVPRKEGDAGIYAYEPREFLYRPGVRPTSPDDELLAVAAETRNAL